MSFTIICDECKSTDVAIDGERDMIAVVTCKTCGQRKFDDEFPNAD